MKCILSVALYSLFFFLLSCSSDRFSVDTSKVDYQPEFLRLDRAIFDEQSKLTQEELTSLTSQYGSFLEVYMVDIMQMPPPDNPMLPEFLSRFTGDLTWQKLQASVDQIYPDLSAQEEVLAEALRAYSIHFGNKDLPQLVAYNSGFNVGIFPSSEWLGVGLEWYLSPENEVVKQLPPDLFPQYKRDKMKPQYLAVNALKGWLFFKNQDLTGEDMLSSMVFNGKMLYITRALMEVTDADLLNYSPAQLEWAEDSEYAIWTYLLENDLVFSTDFRQINKMMNDGPFTPGMPAESPGGVGNWLGLQMVEAYMNENENLTLQDLLGAGDRQILETYKPGR
ncbi:hypothetical protein O3Q51_04180 [Cryomorphaceae bacterium 1068]|nr:hypothetical protein [Cryomorphaceae bacterium 1068]